MQLDRTKNAEDTHIKFYFCAFVVTEIRLFKTFIVKTFLTHYCKHEQNSKFVETSCKAKYFKSTFPFLFGLLVVCRLSPA